MRPRDGATTKECKDLVFSVNNLFTAVHAGFQVNVVTAFGFARVAVLHPIGGCQRIVGTTLVAFHW